MSNNDQICGDPVKQCGLYFHFFFSGRVISYFDILYFNVFHIRRIHRTGLIYLHLPCKSTKCWWIYKSHGYGSYRIYIYIFLKSNIDTKKRPYLDKRSPPFPNHRSDNLVQTPWHPIPATLAGLDFPNHRRTILGSIPKQNHHFGALQPLVFFGENSNES